jgi:hypothetical protein
MNHFHGSQIYVLRLNYFILREWSFPEAERNTGMCGSREEGN